MRVIDIINRSGRSLRHAKARTILTSLAIAVGAFTLTASLAAGEGARQYADQLIDSNINPSTLAISADEAFFGEGQSGPQEYDSDSLAFAGAGGSVQRLSQLTDADIEKIRSIEGISDVQPVYQLQAEYVQGINDAKYVPSVNMYDSTILVNTIAGSLPPLNTQIESGTVVIPESFVEVLGYGSPAEAIGQDLTLRLERGDEISDEVLTILAVTRPAPTELSASGQFFVSLDDARQFYEFSTLGTPQFGRYALATGMAAEGVDPADVRQRLEAAGYSARTAEDVQKLIFDLVLILQSIVSGFGIIALIASVFGIVNTMYISVLERTQQIGLMKALGMRSSHVLSLFLVEAGWIGFIGGVIGATIAIVAGVVANPYITDALGLGDGNYLLVFVPAQILVLLVILVVIAVLAGILPAFKASRLNPIEALRTE